MKPENDAAKSGGLSRRHLLRLGLGALGATVPIAAWLRMRGGNAQIEPKTPPKPIVAATLKAHSSQKSAPIPTRFLGQTGQKVTVFGLGGASAKTPLSNGPREAGIAIVVRALELGVNYFDTAKSYGNGLSEEILGEVAKTRRKEMFLASKTDERTYDGAMRELEGTLKRLQTDHLDLWQMHRASLHERDTRPAFASNGCLKALEKAKSEKIVRFAGVSGHHRSDVLADWLRRFDFDTLLTSINAADVHHADSFIRNLLPVAQERKVGVIAMKVPAYGELMKIGVSMRDAMGYSLSQPGVCCAIIACDSVEMLEENVAVARSFEALSKEKMAEIEVKTAREAQKALFYRSWT